MQGRGWQAWALASLAGLTASPAAAQVTAPPPPRQSVDANGVDLFLGTLNVTSPAVSMGDDDTGLSYYFLNTGAGWSDNVTAALDQNGTAVTVRLGASTDSFTASGTTYTSTEGRGATLVLASNVYTYTASDGTVAKFAGNRANAAPFYASLGRVTSIVSPAGVKLVYAYDQAYYCVRASGGGSQGCIAHAYAYRLGSITNSYGYRIELTYAENVVDPDDPYWRTAGYEEWSTLTATGLKNLKNAGSPTLSLTTGYSGGNFTVTTPAARTTTYRQSGLQVVGITRAGSASENVTVTYSGARVATVATAAGTWTYGAPTDAGNERTVSVTDPSGQATSYVFDIALRRMTRMTDALGHVTRWAYDAGGTGLLVKVTMPEGNAVEYTLGARGNVTATTANAKTGSGQPPIVTATASYPATCANPAICNQPTWTKDAAGNQTDYAYDPTHGGVTVVTLPAPTPGAPRPQVRTSYTGYTDQFGGTVYRATATSTCRTTASCANTADETVSTVDYGTLAANNLLPISTTIRAGDNSVSATMGVAYDAVGNVVGATDPLNAVATFQYDADRWRTMAVGPDPDGAGPLYNRAQRTTYNPDGTVAAIETGTATPAFGGFYAYQQVATSYDAALRPIKTVATAGGATYGVTQTSYDAAARAVCTATRMNPAVYASLPASACTLGTAGASGPDRIVRTVFDQVGRPASVTSAYGVAGVQATEAAATYTDNGRAATATDAKGNVTSYTFDAYDRASRTCFQTASVAACAGSPTDYEQLTYTADGRGLVAGRRLRDGASIAYGHDALGRITSKDGPNVVHWDVDHSYGYDLLGRLTTAADSNGHTLTSTFDALGRRTAQGDNWYVPGNATYLYDAAGRRTRLTWLDGFYVTYDYDATGAITAIRESGTTVLATFAYDDLGRRTSLSRGNGVVTSYGYNAGSQMTSLGLNLAGASSDQTLGFTYNPAGQIASRGASNDAYAWPGAVNDDRTYATNGLNQYTAAGATVLGYDARGNLGDLGGVPYGYTAENRLATTPSVGLAYDPWGRLFNVNNEGGLDVALNYDGDRLHAETNQTTGALLRRYVFGPGVDEPLVWYEGSGTGTKRYLVADERGSIVAVTDASGAALTLVSYDEYGNAASTVPADRGRFGYTGQAWLPSVGLWYYKARMYAPTLGRFMQTDPIGYGDGLNWYDYVGSDPVNWTDPSGLAEGRCGPILNPLEGEIVACGPGGGGGGGRWSAAPIWWPASPAPRRGGSMLGNGGGGAIFTPPPLLSAPEPQSNQCPAIPLIGPGKAALDRNIHNARNDRYRNRGGVQNGGLANGLRLKRDVTGSQNYKADPRYGDAAAPFGNFNFGATAQARGFSLEATLLGSDLADRWENLWEEGDPFSGDDTVDVVDVTNGYNYAVRGCEKR